MCQAEEPLDTEIRLLSQTEEQTESIGREKEASGHMGASVWGAREGNPQRLKARAEFWGTCLPLYPQSAKEYRQRSLLEKELLFFAYDVFGIPFVDPVS